LDSPSSRDDQPRKADPHVSMVFTATRDELAENLVAPA
jgi:hypothetical protein